jgi:hypothetical protein
MPLWKTTVTYEVTVMIQSDDEPDMFDCQTAAHEELQETMSFDDGRTNGVERVLSVSQIPSDWIGAIPRGDGPEMTCEDMVKDSD